MKKPKEPYDDMEMYLSLVGEDCPEEEYPEEYTKDTLEGLYEAKEVYECMLKDDLDNKDYFSAKLTKKKLAEIKDKIIYCRWMMTKGKEEMAIS